MTALGSTTLALANPGTHLPGYARENVTVGMIHIGVGGFHRAHQAVDLDALLSEDESARSCRICGVSLLPQDRRVVEVMNAQDGPYTVLIRHPDGTHQTRIIGSIVDHLFAPDDPGTGPDSAGGPGGAHRLLDDHRRRLLLPRRPRRGPVGCTGPRSRSRGSEPSHHRIRLPSRRTSPPSIRRRRPVHRAVLRQPARQR